MSSQNHISDGDLFLRSSDSDLIPYTYGIRTTDDHEISAHKAIISQKADVWHRNEEQQDRTNSKLVTSNLSKEFTDEASSIDIFTNKRKGKTKKKSSSTISSNTSSSYSSSSGVESMTAGIAGDGNNMSDKNGGQGTCSMVDSSKETIYAVGQWLQFLQMGNYLQDFLDNGYDDLETVKQIGTEDLDAIGVSNTHHRTFILDAVQVLREQGAVWVYLLQARGNAALQQNKDFDGHFMDSLLNHSGSSIETNYREACNGINSSYQSSANSSIVPWCNGAESDSLSQKLPENIFPKSPNIYEQGDRRMVSKNQISTKSAKNEDHLLNGSKGKMAFPHHSSMNQTIGDHNNRTHSTRPIVTECDTSCNSSPSKFAYKDNVSSKFLSKQNFAMRSHEENLIQKVSDVVKVEHCDKFVTVPVEHGQNTTSSTSSNHSQKSSESSNSFYTSIPNRQMSTQQRSKCDPVISLMLSNNQPPLQLHSGIYGVKQDISNEKQFREMLARKEFQMQPTYANFAAKHMPNGTDRSGQGRLVENTYPSYSPGIYASSSCLSDREEEDLYDLAAKYEGGRSSHFNRYISSGQCKPKLSPSGWYQTAKKLMSNKNSSKDDLSLIEGPRDWQGYRSDLGSRIGSPFLTRNASDMNDRFSTRTRLRPGGPLSNVTNSRESYLPSHATSANPNLGYMATMRNGSLPSMTMCEIEEIGMKTMQGTALGKPRFLHDKGPNNIQMEDDLYQISARNRLNRAGRHPQIQSPATPLVKMRINSKDSAKCNGDDLHSSRVQMYGTRVVYSDKDSNASAGIISSSKYTNPSNETSKPTLRGMCKNLPEAAV